MIRPQPPISSSPQGRPRPVDPDSAVLTQEPQDVAVLKRSKTDPPKTPWLKATVTAGTVLLAACSPPSIHGQGVPLLDRPEVVFLQDLYAFEVKGPGARDVTPQLEGVSLPAGLHLGGGLVIDPISGSVLAVPELLAEDAPRTGAIAPERVRLNGAEVFSLAPAGQTDVELYGGDGSEVSRLKVGEIERVLKSTPEQTTVFEANTGEELLSIHQQSQSVKVSWGQSGTLDLSTNRIRLDGRFTGEYGHRKGQLQASMSDDGQVTWTLQALDGLV